MDQVKRNRQGFKEIKIRQFKAVDREDEAGDEKEEMLFPCINKSNGYFRKKEASIFYMPEVKSLLSC